MNERREARVRLKIEIRCEEKTEGGDYLCDGQMIDYSAWKEEV